MSNKIAKKSAMQKKPSAAPVSNTKISNRELTRAEKTANAREAAAKRNAALLSQRKAAPAEASRSKKTAQAREAAAKRNAAMVSPPSQNRAQSVSISPTPIARRNQTTKGQLKKEQQANSRQAINRKVNTQTHAHRNEAKSSKRVSGSVKNIEIKRRSRSDNHSFRVKRAKKRIGKLLLARLTLFFLIFVIMFSLVAAVFTVRLKSGRAYEGKVYTLQLGQELPEDSDVEVAEEDKPIYIDIPKNCATRYGNLYIPVSALSDMCELTVTGTYEDLRYLPRNNEGQSMRFVVDSDIAYVNGAKVRTISPSFIYDGKLYIPLDFMQKYSNGLAIEVDEGNRKIIISKSLEGYDAATDSNIYSVLSFNLSETLPLVPVTEPAE